MPSVNRNANWPGPEGSTAVDLKHTLDQLNGYHDGILQALRTAATYRDPSDAPSASANLIDKEMLQKTLTDYGYPNSYCKDTGKPESDDNQEDGEVEDDMQPCGIIRIRTLKDLLKQLQQYPRNVSSPTGSRISDNEGDHHYGIDSSVYSESSQG